MPFEQRNLDLAISQSRGIFNTYIYETTDTMAQVQATGYFAASRFAVSDPEDWPNSMIQAKCSDGYIAGFVSANGQSLVDPVGGGGFDEAGDYTLTGEWEWTPPGGLKISENGGFLVSDNPGNPAAARLIYAVSLLLDDFGIAGILRSPDMTRTVSYTLSFSDSNTSFNLSIPDGNVFSYAESTGVLELGSTGVAITVPFPTSNTSPVRAQQVIFEPETLSPNQIPANAKRDLITVSADITVNFSSSAPVGYAYYFTVVSNIGNDNFILSAPSGNWYINGIDSGSTTYSDAPLNVAHTVLYDGSRWNIIQDTSGALPTGVSSGARPTNVPIGGKWLDPDITNDPAVRIRRA